MDRKEFTERMTESLRLVRSEHRLTQESMASALGISKKSLVESEKGRRPLAWTECVALACVFSGSRVLRDSFGCDPSELAAALSLEDLRVSYPRTMGGRVWWREVLSEGGLRIQQNLISQHYRLLNERDERLFFSFSLDEVKEYMRGLEDRKG